MVTFYTHQLALNYVLLFCTTTIQHVLGQHSPRRAVARRTTRWCGSPSREWMGGSLLIQAQVFSEYQGRESQDSEVCLMHCLSEKKGRYSLPTNFHLKIAMLSSC